jgi:disulfide oxidoreductase YuzD
MERRFGEEATIEYRDVQDKGVRAQHEKLITEIENRGLLYPVTVIDGVPVYDGAVSYPAILRAVSNKLTQLA